MSATQKRQCRGQNADGEPCRTPIVRKNGWCSVHDPDPLAVAQRKEAALRGGLTTAKKRRATEGGLSAEELGPLATIQDAQRRLRLIAEAVGEGRLTSSAGNVMTSATREWIKAEDVRLRADELAAAQRTIKELRARLEGKRPLEAVK